MFQHEWCAIFLSSLQATGKAGKDASDGNVPREQVIRDTYINRFFTCDFATISRQRYTVT